MTGDRSKARTGWQLAARRSILRWRVRFSAARRFRSHLGAVRKATFDARNRAFRVRACARAEAADLDTAMSDSGIFLTLQRFNDLTSRRQCWL